MEYLRTALFDTDSMLSFSITCLFGAAVVLIVNGIYYGFRYGNDWIRASMWLICLAAFWLTWREAVLWKTGKHPIQVRQQQESGCP